MYDLLTNAFIICHFIHTHIEFTFKILNLLFLRRGNYYILLVKSRPSAI